MITKLIYLFIIVIIITIYTFIIIVIIIIYTCIIVIIDRKVGGSNRKFYRDGIHWMCGSLFLL